MDGIDASGDIIVGYFNGRRIDLRALAQWDHRLDWACLALFVLGPSPIPLWMAGYTATFMFGLLLAAALLSWIWIVWCTDRVIVHLRDRMLLRVSFWMLSPCIPIALIFMGICGVRCGRVLARHGIKVGYFGITRQDLKSLSPYICAVCGYDVRGIESGLCPECGTAFELPAPTIKQHQVNP